MNLQIRVNGRPFEPANLNQWNDFSRIVTAFLEGCIRADEANEALENLIRSQYKKDYHKDYYGVIKLRPDFKERKRRENAAYRLRVKEGRTRAPQASAVDAVDSEASSTS